MLRQCLAAAGCAALLGSAAFAMPAPAAAQGNAYSAAIYSGGCDARGELVADLVPVALPAGEAVGADDGIGAAQSRSSLGIALTNLIATEHALFVADPADPDNDLACGEVGGIVDGGGALVIGLAPAMRGGAFGIAYMTPSATGADVSLFVANPSVEAPAAQVATTSGGDAVLVPGPTPTVAPIPTEAPDDTVEVQAYFLALGPMFTDMGESLDRFAALFDNPRLGQDDWTIQVAAELAFWRLTYESVLALEPPPSLAAIHAEAVESLRLYNEASYLIAAGIDSFDLSQIEQAAAMIVDAGAAAERANDLLDAYRAERGI